MLAKRN